jgi:glycogen synthase
MVSQGGYPSARWPLRAIFLHELCQKLISHHIDVSVVAADDVSVKEVYQGVPIHRIHGQFPQPLARIISTERPHIVHVHFADSAIVGVLAGKLFGRPTIVHGYRDDVDPEKSLKIRLLRAFAFQFTDKIILNSSAARDLALQCGAPAKKCLVLYNSANESRYINTISREEARRRLRLPANIPILLGVGHLIKRKGFDYLVQAASQLQIPIQIIIVGEGEERANLESMIAKQGLESKVRLWGQSRGDDLMLLYKAADIFVHPALHEGHAMVLLEAMASGLPIIATEVSGNVETVRSGVNGLLVPPQSPDSLMAAILRLVEDPSLRERRARNSLQVYQENFSEERQLRELAEIYNSLIAE